MSTFDLPNLDQFELDALEIQIRDDIDYADKEQDAVKSHDLRCLLDQIVAEQEKRGAAS